MKSRYLVIFLAILASGCVSFSGPQNQTNTNTSGNVPQTESEGLEVAGAAVIPSSGRAPLLVQSAVTVRNNGDENATFTTELKVNGVVKDFKDVDVKPEEERTVVLNTTLVREGRHRVDVFGHSAEVKELDPVYTKNVTVRVPE